MCCQKAIQKLTTNTEYMKWIYNTCNGYRIYYATDTEWYSLYKQNYYKLVCLVINGKILYPNIIFFILKHYTYYIFRNKSWRNTKYTFTFIVYFTYNLFYAQPFLNPQMYVFVESVLRSLLLSKHVDYYLDLWNSRELINS